MENVRGVPNRLPGKSEMPFNTNQLIAALFDDPDEPGPAFTPAARRGEMPGNINAHVHLPPNFSAFDSVSQAIQLAADQSIEVLGASNYYDHRVYRQFASEAALRGIFPLFGIEVIARIDDLAERGVKINDPGNPGKMYICGKGIVEFDPLSPRAAALMSAIRRNDSERMRSMVGRLAEILRAAGLDTGLTYDAIVDQVVARYGCDRKTVFLQERHVAQAFQEAIFQRVPLGEREPMLIRLLGTAAPGDPAAVQNGIRSHLMKAGKPAFVDETFVSLDHARSLILEMGGVPCYPVLADGTSPICPFEAPVERLIAGITDLGIHCVELIPVRNSPEILAQYVRAIRASGIIVTAGTEHNTPEMLPLNPTCVNEQPISQEIEAIFQEGACVIAAHQWLMLRGEAGYVDREGSLNPDYSSAEERIAAFRDLGSAIVRRYRERHAVSEG